MAPHVLAAFDQGQIPTIACVNRATVPLGVGLGDLIAAMQEYVDRHVAPVWGTPCKLVEAPGPAVPDGNWGMVFLDDADQAGALGYHDLTQAGFPLSKVFVKTTQDDGGQVSVTASHELAEMLVDPGIQMGALGPKNAWYAYETADAVESESFEVRGIPLSDFVYPAWFEGFRKPNSTQFDHNKLCTQPYQILKGGYMSVYAGGRWTQIFGAAAAKKRFNRENHPRAARRAKKTRLVPSRPRAGRGSPPSGAGAR
jgi:hypothetical protein